MATPLQYSYLENPHGQRSLVGYNPWGHKELNMTEQLSTAQHTHHTVFEDMDCVCVYKLQKNVPIHILWHTILSSQNSLIDSMQANLKLQANYSYMNHLLAFHHFPGYPLLCYYAAIDLLFNLQSR